MLQVSPPWVWHWSTQTEIVITYYYYKLTSLSDRAKHVINFSKQTNKHTCCLINIHRTLTELGTIISFYNPKQTKILLISKHEN